MTKALLKSTRYQPHATVQLSDQTCIGRLRPHESTVKYSATKKHRVRVDWHNVFAFAPHDVPASFARRLFRLSSFFGCPG